MSKPSLSLVTVACALLVMPAVADASGFFLPFRGVRPMGRAGAVAVEGGGPHAMWYNPGALTQLDPGTHILLEGSLTMLNSTFTRTPRLEPNGDLRVYEPVSNEKPPDVIPSLIVTSDFGVEGLVVGAALIGPYATRYRYPTDGAQRYAAIDSAEALNAIMGIGAAYQITDWLAFGATFQNIYFDSKIVLAASAYQGIFGQPEDEDLDILMSLHSVDPFTPGVNFGVVINVYEGLEIGLAGQVGGEIADDDAEIEIRLPTHPAFDGASLEGSQVSGGFDLPSAIRGGVRYDFGLGDVELDVNWEAWSATEAIRTTPEDIALVGLFHVDEFRLGPLTVPLEWQNTLAFNLGGSYEVVPDTLTLRAGVVYEQSAIPEERLSVFQIDLEKVAPTFGFSVEIPAAHLVVDFGYTHIFMATQTVSNSRVEQINPTFDEGAIVIGNGSYEASVDIIGLGIESVF